MRLQNLFNACQLAYCYKIVVNGFLTTFIQLVHVLLQYVITMLTFIELLSSHEYPLSMD